MLTSMINNVIMMVIYMAAGFALCKGGIALPAHSKSLSGILLYILGPCMVINSFLNTEYSPENLMGIAKFFVTTLVLQILFFLLLYLFFHKKYADAKYRILTIGSVLGNVGFFGLPLVASIFPDDPVVTCYSGIYVMSMNLLVFTVGTYLITNDKKYVSLKSAVLNPTTIAIFIALPLYISQLQLPEFVTGAVSVFAKMATPVCMLILGVRLATANLKDLFTRGFVYLTCLMKLFVFPLFAYACVYFLPFYSTQIKISILALSAAPSGAVIESLAELHGCEQELTANVVLLSTLMSILTVPLLVSFFL